MSRPIKNKQGELTLYGLCCGYVEEYNGERYRLQMGLDSSVAYVKLFDKASRDNGFWLNCASGRYREARALYKKFKKLIQLTEQLNVELFKDIEHWSYVEVHDRMEVVLSVSFS